MDKVVQAIIKALVAYFEKNPAIVEALVAALIEYIRKAIEDANKGGGA